MSGTRGGLARLLVLGVALALALLLLMAKEASAGKYAVAQCGWYVGADASWADTTGGAKFRPDAWCVPSSGQDPFDGAHVKSFTRDGQATVSGTRFARWRWDAPAGTGITQVRGTWWHALHDGMEQRLGVAGPGGGFDAFAAAGATDTTPRDFVAGFPTPQAAFEDRLLCARAEGKWCSLEPGSWSALRALTITVEDDRWPSAAIGGELTAGGWRRGVQAVSFSDGDVGGGVRFGETTVDGNRANLTEYACAKSQIGGEWRATLMRPCPLAASGSAALDTTRLSDGPHAVHHCAVDFAGNAGCTSDQTVYVDNNAPAHPRNLALLGGDGWRRTDDFDLSWQNPDQGVASPIGGAFWRIAGPAGYDSGATFTAGRDLVALRDLTVPHAGAYTFSVWLRDEAGNESPASAATLPLRFDDVAPGVAFDPLGEGGTVVARVVDADSGPAGGAIELQRRGTDAWRELPTKVAPGGGPGEATLTAQLPRLRAGAYSFRASATDGAGNAASTTRRSDGAEMTLRVTRRGLRRAAGARRTRIFARLLWRGRARAALTVPFGASAMLAGRLLDGAGRGIGGRRVRIVSRPSRGALGLARVDVALTNRRGRFSMPLAAGPSRRISVSFGGDAALDGAGRAPLTLRVRGGVDLHARPAHLRTGEAVRFSGRVRASGAPLPRRGKLVAIQYFEQAARRWRPVLFVRTDHSGRFHAHYRFRYLSGPASVRLRAAALAEERWPFAPGFSRPLTVRVNG